MPQANIYTATNRRSDAIYDAAGNQGTMGGTTLGYDAENRVVSVTNLPAYGGGSETYVYDGDGRRVQKAIVNGPTTTYAYDIFGKLIAEYSSNPGGTTPPCGTCYISTDHLGSTRLVTGDNAAIIARHDYLPFGEEIPAGQARRNSEWGANDKVNQKFTGKERDLETGLDYFGARYMSSAQGRFTSPDPTFLNILKVTNPQRWNLYGYATNNPLKYIDPDGQEAIAVSYPGYQVGVHGKFTLPLGHAGVVIVRKDGSTHYFEYGRYNGPVGEVRNAGQNNTPTPPVEERCLRQNNAGLNETALVCAISG
jgi:RHS repeat-associated protein